MRAVPISGGAYALLLCVAIVVPNSLQALSFCLLILGGALGARAGLPNVLSPLFMFYLASAVVTSAYLMVGFWNGAPVAAVWQVVVIYVVSPLLWMLAANGIAKRFDDRQLGRLMVILTVAAVSTVGVFYFLYLSGGAAAVSFFKQDANLNIKGGYAGVTMHVFGPLLFLTSAFFAVPSVAGRVVVRWIILGGLAVAALTSGRTALLMAAIIGLAVGFVLRLISKRGGAVRLFSPRSVLAGALSVFVIVLSFAVLEAFSDIDVATIVVNHFDKVVSGGGSARTDQATALLSGIGDSGAMGVGHGIGVDYLRSYDFPWRYELVWLATVLRVGVLGAVVYSAVFVYYIISFVSDWRRGVGGDMHAFFFAGFLSALVASNTNPYIESFVMQWMFVVPMVHFFVRREQSKIAAES